MDDLQKDNKEIKVRLFDISTNTNYAVSMAIKHDKEIFALKERLAL
ncbi:hypothetical protein JCM39194_05320 [Desulfotomaculum varum]